MYTDKIKETLKGERIVLRKFNEQDREAVYEYASDEETLKYLVWEGVKTLEDADKAIADYYIKTPGVYAIALKETNDCIGAIDIRIIEEHDKASFGYVLNKKYWGNGFVTDALYLILTHCFVDLELQRVESTHYKENIGSGRVMQKCGMRYEGLARREEKINGVYQDVVHYGILREDFLVITNVLNRK
ncbi:MAG: GNAT family N-acetyltransferase [Coprobacillaceae bacterium]